MAKFGWSTYLRSHRRHSWSLACTESFWSSYERLRYDTQAIDNWLSSKFVARPLSAPWRGRLLPVLAISRTRFVVAAGSMLHVYVFTSTERSLDAPGMRFEATYNISRSRSLPRNPATGQVSATGWDGGDARLDVTGIAFSPDDTGQDNILVAGFADGHVMRITLPDRRFHAEEEHLPVPALGLNKLYDSGDVIEGFALSGRLSLTLSGSGKVRLQDLSLSPLTASSAFSELHLNVRSWSAYLSPPSTSAPYAAFGTSSQTPLAIHPITPSGLSASPTAILCSHHPHADLDVATHTHPRQSRLPSAVYGIADAPPSFPGAPGQVLVAGWFDGLVRIYDLRSSRRVQQPNTSTASPPSASGSSTPASALAPVVTFADPWSLEPIYAVATGGAAGFTIAAGSARHSVVAFWDIRMPRTGTGVDDVSGSARGRERVKASNRGGWSVHAPGNDTSPVYSIILESSRLFGATQSRPFVYDWGPGVNPATYPVIPVPERGRRNDGLRKTSDVHYYVTTYTHRNLTIGS